MVTKRSSVTRRGIWKEIFENFYFKGHLPPKSEIENRSNRHLTKIGLQVMGCTAERYCLLHVVVQGPGSFWGPVNFSLRRTVAELWGVKVVQFLDFGLFSLYKTPKTYLPVTSLQPRGYIAERFRFFQVVVEGPKGCLPEPEISCNFWLGSWNPQACPNFRLWKMAIPIHNATKRGIRSGPKMSENVLF